MQEFGKKLSEAIEAPVKHYKAHKLSMPYVVWLEVGYSSLAVNNRNKETTTDIQISLFTQKGEDSNILLISNFVESLGLSYQRDIMLEDDANSLIYHHIFEFALPQGVA